LLHYKAIHSICQCLAGRNRFLLNWHNGSVRMLEDDKKGKILWQKTNLFSVAVKVM
jgi:hypothetical protein